MRPAVLVAALAFAVLACSSPAPSPSLTDVERVWCAAHPVDTVNAGVALGIGPSRFVSHKAAVEQATIDDDAERAQALILAWVGEQITATESDPHPDLASMPSWEVDAEGDFERSCLAAYEAR